MNCGKGTRKREFACKTDFDTIPCTAMHTISNCEYGFRRVVNSIEYRIWVEIRFQQFWVHIDIECNSLGVDDREMSQNPDSESVGFTVAHNVHYCEVPS